MSEPIKRYDVDSTGLHGPYDDGSIVLWKDCEAALADKDRRIAELEQRCEKLRNALDSLLLLVKYETNLPQSAANGVVSDAGADEGVYKAGMILEEVRLALAAPPEEYADVVTRVLENERDTLVKRCEKLEKDLRRWIRDIMERREYDECWYADDDGGDCGNWDSCDPHCTLREMMDFVGLKPQEDGGMDKQSLAAQPPEKQAGPESDKLAARLEQCRREYPDVYSWQCRNAKPQQEKPVGEQP